MNYAIVRFGGKQFRIENGTVLNVERQESPLKMDVLAYFDGETLELGTPLLENIEVDAEIVDETNVKTRIGRYKSKSRYRKVNGHKQPFSVIKIKEVSKKGAVKKVAEAKVAKPVKAAAKPKVKKEEVIK